MFKFKSGQASIPMIIFTCLACLGAVFCYIFFSAQERVKQQLEIAKDELSVVEEENKRLERKILDSSELAGWRKGGKGPSDQSEIVKFLEERFLLEDDYFRQITLYEDESYKKPEDIITKVKELISRGALKELTMGEDFSAEDKAFLKAIGWNRKDVGIFNARLEMFNLKKYIVNLLQKNVNSEESFVDDLVFERKCASSSISLINQRKSSMVAEKNRVLSIFTKILEGGDGESGIAEKISKVNEKLSEERRRLNKEIDEVKTKLNNAQEKFRKDKKKLLMKKTKLANELRNLLDVITTSPSDYDTKARRQEEMFVEIEKKDGKIVYSDVRGKLAAINLCKKDKIKRGMRFSAYKIGKAGKKIYKGVVEIKKVKDNLSEVSIIKTYKKYDPIIRGDYIGSPIYNKKRKIIFALVGVFKKYQFNKNEIIKRIKRFGGKVSDEVDVDTDYLIVGDKYEEKDEDSKKFEEAKKLAVKMIRIKNFEKYIED